MEEQQKTASELPPAGTFPNQLDYFIRHLGLQKSQLAKAIGVSSTTLSLYITGRRAVPDDRRILFSQLLKRDVNDIFSLPKKDVVLSDVSPSTQAALHVPKEDNPSTSSMSFQPFVQPLLHCAPMPRLIPSYEHIVLLDSRQQGVGMPTYDPLLLDVPPQDCATWFSEKLASIVAFITQWKQQMDFFHFQMILDRELQVLDENKALFDPDTYFLSRRGALLVIAALPQGLFGLLQQQKAAFIQEDFLPACAASITACWHLLNGREFASVERALSRYMPLLSVWAKHPSVYRKTAAYLASQGFLLLSLLASHRMNLQQRVTYCREGVVHATSAEDRTLHIKAATMFGNALYDQKDYQTMLKTYEEAEHLLQVEPEQIPQVLQSKVYMGLAHAYAQQRQPAKALNAFSKARDIFPQEREEVPPFLAADDGLFALILFEGWVRLDLGEHDPKREHFDYAAQALAQIEHLPQNTFLPERIRIEITNRQAQTAIGLGDLEAFRAYMLQSAEGLQVVASEKRHQEMVMNYKAARKRWPQEKQVLELADVLL